MSLKLIVFQYNSVIQTSKISKNHFFPSFPKPTFQNVITHKILRYCDALCTKYSARDIDKNKTHDI
jgi:hypothetical protein